MSAQRQSTRQRLVQAALHLFALQGVTETTTRQIAELADVNEVTLFRHFGSKHGLLLAVLEEAEVFTQLGEDLAQQANQVRGFASALQAYAEGYLLALGQIPEFVRSLVGEAGQYPIENQQAIGRGLAQLHRHTVQYLTTVMVREQVQSLLPTAKLASLLNTLLLGYAVTEFTTPSNQLWSSREEFIADLVQLFLATESSDATMAIAAFAKETSDNTAGSIEILDLPAPLVRSILQKARKAGMQDYALVYVLFGAGLTTSEIISLQRSHSIHNNQQHLLQVAQGTVRQVSLNQWVMGYRYGSYARNPLTQWLKARKDTQAALFINEAGLAMSEAEIRQCWQEIIKDEITPSGQPPAIEQARQTWCVEMLMRGISLENLSILTGEAAEQLQPYVRRSQEKVALEQAIRLDQRPGSKPDYPG